MGKTLDTRSKDQKLISWSPAWVLLSDRQGDRVGDWAEESPGRCYRCRWCKKTGYYGNRGKHSLLDHSSSEKHKHIAAGVKGRIPGQQSMALVEDHNQNSQVTEVELREAEFREGESDGGERSNMVPSEVLRSTPTVMNHADKVTTAEAVWVLKMIESNFPFNSCENLVDVLKKMAPDSQILKDMTLKSNKSSYILRFGLYPFYLDQLIKRIQKSPTYTLGTDSGTFKLNGLAKIVDIDIRYWDEGRGEVRDEFLDLHSLGHEPADLQVKNIVETLNKNNIHLANMGCLSRDNPSVMQRVFKLLRNDVTAAGCPRLVDAPCLLHPTHTAFMNAEKALKDSIVSLLGNLHGFFSTSTARREDMREVREELAEQLEDEFSEVLGQFFLRHVDTRWLESGPAIQRLLDHWDSTVEYFSVYLPASSLQNNKNALKSKQYIKIASFLSPQELLKTKIRAKFLLFLSNLTKTFLTTLQSEKPMVHKLLQLSFEMFMSFCKLVVKPEFRPKEISMVSKLDLTQDRTLMLSKECGFVVCCREELNSLSGEERLDMRREMRSSAVAMLKHLQTRFPWDDTLLQHLSFLNPKARLESKTPEYGVAVASELKRFSEEEESNLAVQLTLYQGLDVEEVPLFSESGRIDHWWMKVCALMERKIGVKQAELERLVKISCTISHGNAFLERGMSLTKRTVEGRSSLSEDGLKATKVVSEVIKRHGGVVDVPITKGVRAAVVKSWQRYQEDIRKKKEDKEKAEKATSEEVENTRKRKADEAEIQSWKDKKIDLEEKIKGSQVYVASQESVAKEAMQKSLSLKSATAMRTSILTANIARESIVREQKKQKGLQESLIAHVTKKPKLM